jgi:hypothetical protein
MRLGKSNGEDRRVVLVEEISAIYNGSLISASLGAKGYLMASGWEMLTSFEFVVYWGFIEFAKFEALISK